MTNKLLLAIAAALPLAGCVGYGGGGYGGGYGYGYTGPAGGPIGYDGYYDDYYGPITDGYWGDGGDGSGINRLGLLLMEVRAGLA